MQYEKKTVIVCLHFIDLDNPIFHVIIIVVCCACCVMNVKCGMQNGRCMYSTAYIFRFVIGRDKMCLFCHCLRIRNVVESMHLTKKKEGEEKEEEESDCVG